MEIDKKNNKEEEISTSSKQVEVPMDIDDLEPPQPDNIYGNSSGNCCPNQDGGGAHYNYSGKILNEKALKELIEKEEKSLSEQNNNNKSKTLEEIKNNLNSLNSYYIEEDKKIYKEKFYSDLKNLLNK